MSDQKPRMEYTGKTERMSWATKRFFRYVDANGKEIPGSTGWDWFYETPEQKAHHERCKAGLTA